MVSHTRTEEQSLAQWEIQEADLRPCPWDDPEKDLVDGMVVEVTEEYNNYVRGLAGETDYLLCYLEEIDQDLLAHNFWDEEAQNFGGGFHGSWVIWPGDLFPGDDPFTLGHARHLRSMLESHMNMEGDGGGYEGCGILALASIYRDDPEVMDFLRQAVSWLAHEVATPGTGHFGEFFFMVDWDGDGRKEYVNHSAIPHAWNHALFVISALEVFGTAAD